VRESDINPAENRLKPGINEGSLLDAIDTAGYPLQSVVASKLLAQFRVTEEWGYVDSESKQHRSLDVFGFRVCSEGSEDAGFPCTAAILVECKRSRAPFIFFKRVSEALIPQYPHVAGLGAGLRSLQTTTLLKITSVPLSSILGLNDTPFVAAPPARCSALARAELNGDKVRLSGDDAYNSVVLPLVKATRHAESLYNGAGKKGSRLLTLILPIAVIDAPMLLVETPQTSRDPVASPWLRIVRQEAREGDQGWYRWDAIDAVHIGFLDAYLSDHLLPFLRTFASRVVRQKDVLRQGGIVEDLSHWTWSEVQPATRRGA